MLMRLLSIRQAWAEMNILDRGWIAQPVITIACRSLDFILADAPRTSVAYSVSAGANFRSLVRYRIPIASGPRLRKFRGTLPVLDSTRFVARRSSRPVPLPPAHRRLELVPAQSLPAHPPRVARSRSPV